MGRVRTPVGRVARGALGPRHPKKRKKCRGPGPSPGPHQNGRDCASPPLRVPPLDGVNLYIGQCAKHFASVGPSIGGPRLLRRHLHLELPWQRRRATTTQP